MSGTSMMNSGAPGDPSEAGKEQGGEASRGGAQEATRAQDGESGQREPLGAEAVGEHAGQHAGQPADHVEHGRDESRLHQGEAELGAQHRQRRRHFADAGAGDQPPGEYRPDSRPAGGGADVQGASIRPPRPEA